MTKARRKRQDGWRGTNIREEMARLIEQLSPSWSINEFIDVAVKEKLQRDNSKQETGAK